MIVYYRLCAIASSNPSPIYHHDKDKLNIICLRSFVKAFLDIKPKVIFLCDHCPHIYNRLIDNIVPFDKDIIHTDIGIDASAVKQFIMASTEDDDILFQECDYIYEYDIGKKLQEAVKELGMVSPYDHPAHYQEQESFKIKIVNDTHWRSTLNNTMTFAIRNDIFKDHSDIFLKYGYLDRDNWDEMREKGHLLWVPIPSFATHMAKEFIAPSVDWRIDELCI